MNNFEVFTNSIYNYICSFYFIFTFFFVLIYNFTVILLRVRCLICYVLFYSFISQDLSAISFFYNVYIEEYTVSSFILQKMFFFFIFTTYTCYFLSLFLTKSTLFLLSFYNHFLTWLWIVLFVPYHKISTLRSTQLFLLFYSFLLIYFHTILFVISLF